MLFQRDISFNDLDQTKRNMHAGTAEAQNAGPRPPRSSDLQAVIVEPLHPIVPLSSIPCAALGVETAEQKAKASHVRSCSRDSAAVSAGSSKTGAMSQLVDKVEAKAEDLKLRFNRPRQVTGLATKYHTALAWAGRIGWVGKAVVYAMIGGLACQFAVSGYTPDPNLVEAEQISASPQGAFVLLSTTGQVSIVILLVMMVALAAYIIWRFWEGLAGQGYDDTFSAKKNFFKCRVSPIVSGAVYISYMIFLINVLDRQVRNVPTEQGVAKEGWPATWRHSTLGRIGLAVLGIAFCIATCIQLQGVLTKQWHRDYRSDLPRWLMLTVFTIGHFGFAGRAGAFLAMAVLFFKDAGGVDDTAHNSSMVSNALQQLQTSRGLRAILMIVGILLIAYGLFATLSACTRMFPTPPPSRRKRLPAAEFKEHKERKAQRKLRGILPRHHQHHDDKHPAGSELSPSRSATAAASSTGQPGSEAHISSTNGSMGGNGSYSVPQQGGVQHPSSATDGAWGRTSSGRMLPAYSAALTNATSTASSLPHAVDESPGWGADQGRSRPSLDLDQAKPQASEAVPHRRSSGSGTSTSLRQGGSKGGIGAASRALGQSWFTLPNQRQQPGASAAFPAAEVGPAAGEGQHAVDSAPGSPSSVLDSHSPRDRQFVTVDL